MGERDDISGLDTIGAPSTPKEEPPPTVESLPEVAASYYEVLGEQGRGGMGRVLVALDRRLGRKVAVKELLSSRPEATQRFVREALVTARLQHPSIVPVHEAGRWPSGEPFYSMKLVQGRPLDAVLREKRTFAERLALLPVIIAVAEAVAYAHSRRVIHRDLKPPNIIIGEFGETIVLDWGLAKELAPDQVSVAPSEPAPRPDEAKAVTDSGQTQDGSVVGTPGFMSPEQAAGEAVDLRTDVFALGAMLYTVLCGAPPFRGRTPIEVLNEAVRGRVVPIREREPQVPDELVDVLQKAMARARDERYHTARELAEELRRFQTGQLVAAHRYSTSELVRRWLRRHRVVMATVGAALLLVAGFGAFSVRRVLRERDRAESAQARAEAARAREAERVDELTVVHARAVLDRDPTSSLAWLKRLRPGSSRFAAAVEVAADARRRGIAERRFAGHSGAALALAFSPDGKRLASAGADGTVRLWPVGGGEALVLGPVKAEIGALAFLPDGRHLLSAGSDGRLSSWDMSSHIAVVMEAGHGRITHLQVSADGKRAATASADGALTWWDLAANEPRGSIELGRAPSALALSFDGKRMAARIAGAVRVFEDTTPRLSATLPGDGALAFAPDGTLAAGGAGEVRLWDPAGRARSLPIDGRVTLVVFSTDGQRLAAAVDDGSVAWWDLPSATRHPLSHKGDAARELAFSTDGTRLLSTRGETVRVWVLPVADPRKLRGPSAEVSHALFAPDGARVAVCALDGSVWVYRLGPGLLPAEPEPPPSEAPLRVWLDSVTDAQIAE